MGKISRALEKSQEGISPEEANDGRTPLLDQQPMQAKPGSAPEETEQPKTQAGNIDLPEISGSTNREWDERLLKVAGFSGILSESFRVLRTRILHPVEDEKKIKTVLVTSTAPEEGKSFVTANLGISLARGMDQHCLVVDCDLRRPALADLLGMGRNPGLADYLQNTHSIAQMIQKTSVDKLSILASGNPPVNPSELLTSGRMQGLVQELASRYDDRIIIFDSPPVKVASETMILAQQVDSVVLVVRWGSSGREHVKKIIEDIGREKIVGIVFNGYKSNIIESKMIKYSNYYYYDYASKDKQSEKKSKRKKHG
jgi:exopolysaccharide/PEP-CTERM locus tyrosine autokinase